MTVPALVMTRSPDGVSTVPAGTPVVVASGNPLVVVTANVFLPRIGMFAMRQDSTLGSIENSENISLGFQNKYCRNTSTNSHLMCLFLGQYGGAV
jgi:hypothetical protein